MDYGEFDNEICGKRDECHGPNGTHANTAMAAARSANQTNLDKEKISYCGVATNYI